ncbi:unnamed protein product [Ixodes persulcatus]
MKSPVVTQRGPPPAQRSRRSVGPASGAGVIRHARRRPERGVVSKTAGGRRRGKKAEERAPAFGREALRRSVGSDGTPRPNEAPGGRRHGPDETPTSPWPSVTCPPRGPVAPKTRLRRPTPEP